MALLIPFLALVALGISPLSGQGTVALSATEIAN
jgi:hypothetical protein